MTTVDSMIATASQELARLTGAWSAAPVAVDCVALAPAGGAIGPAAKGPVDAVVLGPVRRTPVPDRWASTANIRLLTVAHTRCWVLSSTLRFHVDSSDVGGRPELAPDPGILPVPELIAADTARVDQFMHDRGHGADWPQLLLLGSPVWLDPATVVVAAATTASGAAAASAGSGYVADNTDPSTLPGRGKGLVR